MYRFQKLGHSKHRGGGGVKPQTTPPPHFPTPTS